MVLVMRKVTSIATNIHIIGRSDPPTAIEIFNSEART